jgi:hypothetical protein
LKTQDARPERQGRRWRLSCLNEERLNEEHLHPSLVNQTDRANEPSEADVRLMIVDVKRKKGRLAAAFFVKGFFVLR